MRTMADNDPAGAWVAPDRRYERVVVWLTLLVAALFVSAYLVSWSIARRDAERNRERAAVEAQRNVIEAARQQRALAMMRRPQWQAALRQLQDLSVRGTVRCCDFEAGSVRVDPAAWAAMPPAERHALARLFWEACTPPEDGAMRGVRVVSDRDEKVLAEVEPESGAVVEP
jgi:hypothetical protein